MKLDVSYNVPLAPLTTLGVGGLAQHFVHLTDEQQLPLIAEYAKDAELDVCVLGGGSNVLVSDSVIERLVVKNELRGITAAADGDTVLVTAAAGESWDSFVEDTVGRGLAGLENLSGIPGTVGAAPIQNINAYGASAATTIDSVQVFDWKTSEFITVTAGECAFGYRDSIFKQPAGASLIVAAVTFRLAPAGKADFTYRSASQSIERYLAEKDIATPTIADVREAVLNVRSNIGMLPGQFRSAGSFFKNTIVSTEVFESVQRVVVKKFSEKDAAFSPWHWELPDGQVKISTAFLMECSPYNKQTYGERRDAYVGLSPKHSLSIVTEEGATAADVHSFVEKIVSAISDEFGITIESEVNMID